MGGLSLCGIAGGEGEMAEGGGFELGGGTSLWGTIDGGGEVTGGWGGARSPRDGTSGAVSSWVFLGIRGGGSVGSAMGAAL